jgi:hypothetical protein
MTRNHNEPRSPAELRAAFVELTHEIEAVEHIGRHNVMGTAGRAGLDTCENGVAKGMNPLSGNTLKTRENHNP